MQRGGFPNFPIPCHFVDFGFKLPHAEAPEASPHRQNRPIVSCDIHHFLVRVDDLLYVFGGDPRACTFLQEVLNIEGCNIRRRVFFGRYPITSSYWGAIPLLAIYLNPRLFLSILGIAANSRSVIVWRMPPIFTRASLPQYHPPLLILPLKRIITSGTMIFCQFAPSHSTCVFLRSCTFPCVSGKEFDFVYDRLQFWIGEAEGFPSRRPFPYRNLSFLKFTVCAIVDVAVLQAFIRALPLVRHRLPHVAPFRQPHSTSARLPNPRYQTSTSSYPADYAAPEWPRRNPTPIDVFAPTSRF